MPTLPSKTLLTAKRCPRSAARQALLLAVVGWAAGVSSAGAWWSGDWALRKLITIDTSGSGVAIGEPLAAVPVLLRLHDGDFRFADAKSDGTDLRFVSADDKTLLSYHIEKFDTLLDEAFIWVNVPGLKPGAKTSFWLYYGNAGNKAVKVESAKDTYDSDTSLVYHFNEHGQPCFDFSGQGNGAANAGVTADGSYIGSGLRLDGRVAVTIPASSSLSWAPGGSATWSAWVKFGQPQSQAVMFSRRDGSAIFLVGADMGVPFVALTSQGAVTRTAAGTPVAPQTWHHLAVIAGNSRVELYLDGQLYSAAAASLPGMNGPANLGGDGSGVANGITGFVGEMDELEISRIARPPSFIQFEAAQQSGEFGPKVLALGVDEQPTNWFSFIKKGYIGVIIGSLTIDGWVVIGILGVMAMVSWMVMVSKARLLGRVGKGNELFLKEWRRNGLKGLGAENASVLTAAPDPKKPNSRPKEGAMRHSPLFRVYNLGLEEIGHRFSGDQGDVAVKVISARSIEAIRATLDGGLVRESQKLSSQMVLLTIAISGGPFLGLLGTVVGVMITFAAVAQAGDVNVNAIAPGIAAALAATVAGLAVAIPALFGYNYLLTQIKGITSDLHVFIDEFVTKLAEHYEDGSE